MLWNKSSFCLSLVNLFLLPVFVCFPSLFPPPVTETGTTDLNQCLLLLLHSVMFWRAQISYFVNRPRILFSPLDFFLCPCRLTHLFPSVTPLSPPHVMSPSLTLFSRMQQQRSPLLAQLTGSENPSTLPRLFIRLLSPSLFFPLVLHCSSLCLFSLSLSSLSPPQLFCFDFSSELPPSSSLFINTPQLPHSTALKFSSPFHSCIFCIQLMLQASI